MQLTSLRLRTFRAHREAHLEFAPKVNLLHGPNGTGKTNVLEAIHYLCLSKSFLQTQDAFAVTRGADFFEIEGRFIGRRKSGITVRMAYAPKEGKRIFVNGAPLERLVDIVGMLPVVVLAPADIRLTAGGPEERRKFLDSTLCQTRPAYLHDLLRYRRALRQRNALLTALRQRKHVDPHALEAWSEELVLLGARLTWRRAHFVQDFSRFLKAAHEQVDALGEPPSIAYHAAVPAGSIEDEPSLARALREKLARLVPRERALGRTLAGPHRDELVFRLGAFEVRPYASQGQHRTFALALKLATYFFLRDHLDEEPLLLLDDVFGILDARRTEIIAELLQSTAISQSIVTAAHRDALGGIIPFERPEHRALPIVDGVREPVGEGGC